MQTEEKNVSKIPAYFFSYPLISAYKTFLGRIFIQTRTDFLDISTNYYFTHRSSNYANH
jgi:hypothetical protein